MPLTEDVLAPSSDPDRVGAEIREVIQEEARSGNAVIMGRGGVFILGEVGGVAHFRLVGRREDRIARISSYRSCTSDEAERLVNKVDRDREAHVRYFFDADPRDPHHYHMVLNTSAIGYEAAARIIVETVLGRRAGDLTGK